MRFLRFLLPLKFVLHANGMEIIQRRVGPLIGPAGLPWSSPLKIPTLKAVELSPSSMFVPSGERMMMTQVIPAPPVIQNSAFFNLHLTSSCQAIPPFPFVLLRNLYISVPETGTGALIPLLGAALLSSPLTKDEPGPHECKRSRTVPPNHELPWPKALARTVARTLARTFARTKSLPIHVRQGGKDFFTPFGGKGSLQLLAGQFGYRPASFNPLLFPIFL